MKYLIVKVSPLNDGYECDADREPYKVVENWKTEKVKGMYEVYAIHGDGSLTLIKEYDTALESGMALYFVDINDDWSTVEPTVVYKYPGLTRKDKVPKEVKQYVKDFDHLDPPNNLTYCGSLSYDNDDRRYVYGEYFDDRYRLEC